MIKTDVIDVIELGVLVSAWTRATCQEGGNKLAYKAIKEKLIKYDLDELEIPKGDYKERLLFVEQLKVLFHKMGKELYAKAVVFGSLISWWYSGCSKDDLNMIRELAQALDIPLILLEGFLTDKVHANQDNSEGFVILTFLEDLRRMSKTLKIFFGYGHNYSSRQKVENFLRREGYGVFTIDDANQIKPGATIIELLEMGSIECNCAVILFTCDDEIENQYRPRQNVVHELGFFQGKFGRDKVILLVEKGTQIFSNISGILYVEFESNKIQEKFHGLSVLLNKVKSTL